MNLIACDGNWTSNAEGVIACSGTLTVIAQNEIGHPAMTTEEAQQLIDYSIMLFVTVFGFLALKKALLQ